MFVLSLPLSSAQIPSPSQLLYPLVPLSPFYFALTSSRPSVSFVSHSFPSCFYHLSSLIIFPLLSLSPSVSTHAGTYPYHNSHLPLNSFSVFISPPSLPLVLFRSHLFSSFLSSLIFSPSCHLLPLCFTHAGTYPYHSSYRPPIQRHCPSVFTMGDACLLDPSSHMHYDRIYVGAMGSRARDLLRFRELLNTGGVLVGPFDNTLWRVERTIGGFVETEIGERTGN